MSREGKHHDSSPPATLSCATSAAPTASPARDGGRRTPHFEGATYDLMRRHDSHLSLTGRQRVTNGRRVVPPELALTSSRLVSLLPFRFWGRSGQKGGKSGRVEMRGLCRPSAPLCKSGSFACHPLMQRRTSWACWRWRRCFAYVSGWMVALDRLVGDVAWGQHLIPPSILLRGNRHYGREDPRRWTIRRLGRERPYVGMWRRSGIGRAQTNPVHHGVGFRSLWALKR